MNTFTEETSDHYWHSFVRYWTFRSIEPVLLSSVSPSLGLSFDFWHSLTIIWPNHFDVIGNSDLEDSYQQLSDTSFLRYVWSSAEGLRLVTNISDNFRGRSEYEWSKLQYYVFFFLILFIYFFTFSYLTASCWPCLVRPGVAGNPLLRWLMSCQLTSCPSFLLRLTWRWLWTSTLWFMKNPWILC